MKLSPVDRNALAAGGLLAKAGAIKAGAGAVAAPVVAGKGLWAAMAAQPMVGLIIFGFVGWVFWQIKDSTQRPENSMLAFIGDHMWSIALILLAVTFLILSGRKG